MRYNAEIIHMKDVLNPSVYFRADHNRFYMKRFPRTRYQSDLGNALLLSIRLGCVFCCVVGVVIKN